MKKTRKLATLALTAAIALSTTTPSLAAPEVSSLEPRLTSQATAITPMPRVLGAANDADTTVAVAKLLAPSGSPTIHLAASGNNLALAQAVSNAGLSDTVALSANGTDPITVLAQLAPIKATDVYLTGPIASFPAPLIDALSAEYHINTDRVSDSMSNWSPVFTDATSRTHVVVGNPGVVNSAELAATFAANAGGTLVLVDANTDTKALAGVLDDPSNLSIDVFGEGEVLSALPELSESASQRLVTVPLSDIAQAERTIALKAVGAGANIKKVIAPSTNNAGARALAALVAKRSNAVIGTVAASNRHVPLLNAPAVVGVVGRGATEAQVVSIEQKATAAFAAPASRVLNTTVTTTNHTITFTAVAGATKYVAFDLTGKQVATSTKTSIVVPGKPGSLAISAQNAKGATLGTLQYKVNEYASAANRADAILGSTSNANNHLVFLGSANLPRLITRYAKTIDGSASPAPVAIALTCASSFTDISRPKTLQYQYIVETVSQNKASCNSTGIADATGVTQVGAVVFPPTQFPSGVMRGSSEESDAGVGGPQQASGSVVEKAVASQAELAEAENMSRAGTPGADWPNMMFRYQTFIPDAKLVAPGSSGWPLRPFQAFGGDNRTKTPNGSFRYRQEAIVRFGQSHNVLYSEYMGETSKYACRWFTSDCELQQKATAPLSQLWMSSSSHTNTSARWTFEAKATIPLHALAPPIDAAVTVNLQGGGGSTVTGWHDTMPTHEIYFFVVGWEEWEEVYVSTYRNPLCLFGGLAAPACTTRINVAL